MNEIKATLYDENGHEMIPPNDLQEDEYYTLLIGLNGSQWVKNKAEPLDLTGTNVRCFTLSNAPIVLNDTWVHKLRKK